MEKIKVAIAEKNDNLRAQLVHSLSDNNDFEIVIDSPGSIDLFDQIARIETNVLLLSNRLIGYNGLQALEIIRSDENLSRLKIIMFTNEIDEWSVKQSAALGANSLIDEFSDLEEIENCIRIVSNNNYHFNKFFTPEFLLISN
jgi:two-component system chemotaxis response regulator CheY